MNNELTWDKDVDAVVTTPQSQWTAYQIAVANLNPELKQRNKRYQTALNSLNILENEKVNLWQAGQIMMDAYKEAMSRTDEAAENQMMANSANANIQAWWAISWLWGLATNPWAAAQTRLAAQNQAAAQNATVRSNADQNIANLYSNAAQVPATLASMSSTNAQIDANNRQLDLQESQAEANNKLAEAQANYYNNQANNNGSNTVKQTTTETPAKEAWTYSYNWKDWKTHTVVVSYDSNGKQSILYDWQQITKQSNIDSINSIIANRKPIQ